MRKKSRYKPKGIRLDNMSWIQAGLKKVGSLPTAGVALKLRNRQALDELLMGTATRDHMDVLIAAFNMAEALYKINKDLGLDWADEIKDAQEALFTLGKRCMYNDNFAATSREREVLKMGMEIHDVQLDNCTVIEMEKSIDLVNTVIRNKQARQILAAV